jgi:hypothetical protein
MQPAALQHGAGGGQGWVDAIPDRAAVRLHKLNSLASVWFQPLRLRSEKLVSKFAFTCNLYRYAVVGLCTLNQVDP